MSLNMLDCALEVLSAHPNWFLFPIIPLKKEPLIENNLNLASKDASQIRMWHNRWRGCNWGVSAAKSGILIADVDIKKGAKGMDTFDALNLKFGFPETFTVRSPSGGLHYYYVLSPEFPEHVNKLGKAGFGEGMDSPNYVLIPGCRLRDTWDGGEVTERSYEIIADRSVAPAPGWFSLFLKKSTAESDGASEPPVSDIDTQQDIDLMIAYLKGGAPKSIAGQTGNNTVYMVAEKLRDNGISEHMALKLIATYYNVPEKCEPLWNVDSGPEKDRLDIIVSNAYRYGQNRQGSATAEAHFDGETLDPKDVEQLAEAWEGVGGLMDRFEPIRQAKKTGTRENPDRAENVDDAGMAPEPEKPDDDPPPNDSPPPNDPPPDDTVDDSDFLGREDEAEPPNKTKYTMDQVCREWVWVVSAERFVRKSDGLMWSKTQFDSRFNHLPEKGTSISAQLFKMRERIQRFERLVYRPGKPITEGACFNLWRPSPIKPVQGDTSVWDEHLAYLFSNEKDRNLVLNWMAWVYQNVSRKPNHGLLIIGKNTGTGKSFLSCVLEQLIGTENTQRPKNSSLKGEFNAWALQCKLCIIEELMQTGRRDVANELRDTITESTIEVNIKNISAQKIENYAAMMAITNHYDPIPMEDTERRWLVIETFAKRSDVAKDKPYSEKEYYKRLWSIVESPDMLAAIAYELQNRDLGDYDAKLSPEETSARSRVIQLSRSDVEQWMYEQQSNPPLAQQLVQIAEIVGAMPPALQRGNKVRTSIQTFLRDKMRGAPIRAVRLGDGTRVRLWALEGKAGLIEQMTDMQIAEKYETERKMSASARPDAEQAASDFGDAD